MKKGVILTVIFFIGFIYLVNADCYIADNCEGTDMNILDVSGTSNAHVSADNPTYMKLCCPSSTYITSAQVTQTCDGTTPLRLYSLDNSHIEVPPNNYYTYSLCLNSEMICSVVENGLSCNTLGENYFCLLKYKGNLRTNAHVADCDYTFYENSVCCVSSEIYGQVECSEQTEPCLAPGISNCCQPPIVIDPLYCSYGENDYPDPGEQGYCCPTGQYWIGVGCISAQPCYPDPCPYILTQDPANYFNFGEECVRESSTEDYWEACCYDQIKYGTEYYGYCEIEAV